MIILTKENKEMGIKTIKVFRIMEIMIIKLNKTLEL
jgi:hypothetical protein